MGSYTTLIRARLVNAWEKLRMSFWFVPTLMIAAAAILAVVTLFLDDHLSDAVRNNLPWIYGGGPEGARSVLSTIASSSITVAGTTFSITIAALSLASGQFGPRLLRNFVRDTGNQIVLGTFVATFLYCLLVLRTVQGIEDERVVPHISVTVGVLLSIANLGVLIYFIHHVAMSIRADQVIAIVGQDLDHTIEHLFPAQLGHGVIAADSPEALQSPEGRSDAEVLRFDNDGYVQVIDAETLMDSASEHDLIVTLLYRPGDFVVAGETAALLWPAAHVDRTTRETIRGAFMLGHERSAQQDVLFVMNQLVEVAVRALSPGINDPFTAISCLDRLTTVLCRVAQRPLPDGRRYSDDDRLRVVAKPIRFEELVDAAFDQIRTYGRQDVKVMSRLLDLLTRIGGATSDPARRAPLIHQAELTYAGSAAALSADGDRETLEHYYRSALFQLNDLSGTHQDDAQAQRRAATSPVRRDTARR